MPIERAKFIKMMMMTTSSNDGEALAAIRKANAMLASANMNWEEFVIGKGHRPQGRGTSTATHDNFVKITDPKIKEMLQALLLEVKGGFREFVKSINEHLEEKHYLTQRQYDAIKNAYERLN